jgi:hypothetical protein
MIGFDGVIPVLFHDVARDGDQLFDHSRVGRCPVGTHLGRVYAVFEGLGEKPRVAVRSRFGETSTSMT